MAFRNAVCNIWRLEFRVSELGLQFAVTQRVHVSKQYIPVALKYLYRTCFDP